MSTVPAEVEYVVDRITNPWRKDASDAWMLVRLVYIGEVVVAREPVAVFNLDSEAENFVTYLKAGGRVR